MFALAEKCWAFMQSRKHPQPWFSAMRLTSSMHETRRETADAVDRELGQHIIIGRLKYYKEFHEGACPTPNLDPWRYILTCMLRSRLHKYHVHNRYLQ